MQDFTNSNNHVLYFGAASLFLPDTTYYQNEQSREQLIGLFTATTMQLLTLYGYEPAAAQKLITEALAFDALLVPVTKSSVESADYVKLYNPLDRKEVSAKAKNINLVALADSLVESKIDKLIITNLDLTLSREEWSLDWFFIKKRV